MILATAGYLGTSTPPELPPNSCQAHAEGESRSHRAKAAPATRAAGESHRQVHPPVLATADLSQIFVAEGSEPAHSPL